MFFSQGFPRRTVTAVESERAGDHHLQTRRTAVNAPMSKQLLFQSRSVHSDWMGNAPPLGMGGQAALSHVTCSYESFTPTQRPPNTEAQGLVQGEYAAVL